MNAGRIVPLRRRPYKSERHLALDEHATQHGYGRAPHWHQPPRRVLPFRLRFAVALICTALLWWASR